MTHQRSWYARMMQALLLLLLAGSAAMAAVPTAPTDLKAAVETDDYGRYVTLTWKHMSSTQQRMDQIDIYQQLSPKGFMKVATMQDTIYGDGYYRTPYLQQSGQYSFYLIARNSDGESPASQTVTVSVTIPNVAVRFVPTGQFYDSTFVGAEYKRTQTAEASDGSPVRYKLLSSFGTVDAVTGEFTHIFSQVGYSTVRIQAYLENDPSIAAVSSWNVIAILDPSKFCASIKGAVTDAASGSPVQEGVVYAVPLDSMNASTATARISNGVYTMRLANGAYRLYASAAGYEVAYNADIITVDCNEATVDFRMEATPLPVYDTVSGRVTRKSDGKGVSAWVVFRDVQWRYADSTVTDADGYYVAIVQRGFQYYGSAHPSEAGLGYQYYKNARGPQDATIVETNGNLNGIDFVLGERRDGAISGIVTDSKGKGLYGNVVLYQVSAISGQPDMTVASTSARAGQFSFNELDKGTYILWAEAADSALYTPGYYRQNTFAVRTWDKATQITIDVNQQMVGNVVIKLKEANGSKGSANLKGKITSQKGRIKQDGGSALGSAPLVAAVVMAVDKNDEMSGYAMTNAQGEFEINDLAVGAYQVIVDRVGYEVSISSVTINGDDETQEIDVPMTAVEAVSGVEAPAVAATAVVAYPNPARESLTLNFRATSGAARVTVVGADGSEVLVRRIETIDGMNALNLDTRDLAAGVYFVRIQAGGTVGTVTITVIR